MIMEFSLMHASSSDLVDTSRITQAVLFWYGIQKSVLGVHVDLQILVGDAKEVYLGDVCRCSVLIGLLGSKPEVRQ